MVRVRLTMLAAIGLAAALAVMPAAGRSSARHEGMPSRVSNAIQRTSISLRTAESYVDTGDASWVATSLTWLSRNVARSDRAAREQLPASAVPSLAVLRLDQRVVTSLADCFDGQSGSIASALRRSLLETMRLRDLLLAAVLPRASADVLEHMRDGHADEAANLTQILAHDRLSPRGRSAIKEALRRSQVTLAKVAASSGDGEQ